MKTIQYLLWIIGLIILPIATHAITNTAIAVSGTNIVLSWPSYGYESYLIQYRKTLDPTDAWSNLANGYYANSTNRTTYTVFGVVSPPPTSGVFSSMQQQRSAQSQSQSAMPMVKLSANDNFALPLAIFPPGYDFSQATIYDPASGEWVAGSDYSANSQSRMMANNYVAPPGFTNNASGDGSGGGAVDTGFFRVFHIPDWLVGFDGYTFDGPTFLPIDFASPDAPTNYVDNISLLVNGQPTDAIQFLPYNINGTTYWGLGVYFDQMPNGTNTIQLLTTVRQSDELNDQTPYMTFSNAPQSIVIGNTISFTNWSDFILSNTYTINSQSSRTNVDWEIDIYDVYGDFVNYQTGHSDDGSISWTWDLTDYNGNSRIDDNDPFFYPYVTVFGNSESPQQSGGVHPNNGTSNVTSGSPAVANKFPTVGSWVFAYMDNFYDDGSTLYSGADYYYTNGIHAMEGGPALWQVAPWDFPIKYGRNYTQAERDASWDTLRETYLKRWTIRNFYYFGHGSTSTIGGDQSSTNADGEITGSANLSGSRALLTSSWVRQNVTANKYLGGIPFRFVFLDGCSTAKGDWPLAWGVPKQQVSADWYKDPQNNPTGSRPNAFVGWDTDIGGKDWGTVNKHWQFNSFWMAGWSVNSAQETLQQAFRDAEDGSQWVNETHFQDLKIFGYQNIKFLEYNYSGDWP